MPQIEYVHKSFTDAAYQMVRHVRRICADYAAQGLDLTLRQVYYQCVAHDLFPDDRTWRQVEGTNKWVRDPDGTKNAEPNYKWLGGIVNDARLAGMLDWDFIVDRTRNLRSNAHWNDPASVIRAAARGYAIDKWADQDHRIEVWIEKDALVGVLETCCPQLDVPFFSCRGYTSQSEVWGAAQRLGEYIDDGKKAVIIHLGDHDPSGIDMSRDIEHRLATFIAQDRLDATLDEDIDEYLDDCYDHFTVERIALNWDQVQQYNPPPNPAKLSDSRGAGYVRRYGRSSWELDALDPPVLVDLIQNAVGAYRDEERWEAAVEAEEQQRKILTAAEDHWEEVAGHIRESWPDEVNGD